MSNRDPHQLRHHHEIRGLRVGTVLLLVALIPLVGLAVTTWRSIGEARAVVAAASRAEKLSQQAVALAELDSAVFDEMVWTVVNSVIETIELPPGLMGPFTDTDPAAQLVAVSALSDEMVVAADRPDVAAALATARQADDGLGEVLAQYGAITESIETPLAALLQAVATSATGTTEGEPLADDIHVLELAVEARAVIAEEIYGYFATVFAVRGTPAEEIAGLIELRQRYDDAMASLAAGPVTSPGLDAARTALATDPTIVRFTSSVDALVADSLSTGVPATGAELSLPKLLVNIDGLTDVLAAIGASATTLRLLDRAVDAVLTSSRTIRAHADNDIRQTYGLALALMITSFVMALLAARFIVRPLRGLRRAAENLQTNQESIVIQAVGGPAEVKAAAQAIQDAAAHFDLVTRQARALAGGALDATVLDEVAPGGLGVALQHAVGTLRTALSQQDEFRRRLAHEAAHDGLTKLANRNASMAQLTRSLARTTRSGGQLAVLFIDLDRFKDVNDLHGHQAGDAVLTAAAQRLVTSVREGDHVGRLGGDEFVVIAEPVSGIDETVSLARRILERLTEPIDIGTACATIGASIGIALTDGTDLTADELLRDADLAVYRAKAVGRGGIEICNEDLRNELAETADLTVAIRHAIAHDELVVHYQPIVDTQTQRIHALEALVRWQRPGEELLVPPDRFIGFAERSTLIIDIDRWVLDAVARQVAVWNRDARCADVPVAINISGRHLGDDHVVEHILQPLEKYGVDPRGIIIEITESALLDDLATAATKLQRLRDHGVLISIDDFGTGYTSLAHLRSLPVDILKIDRTFTANAATDPHEESIVKLIIDTGHLLGATITAEGIETVHEADKLAGLGTDNLQGFYFARPQPPDQLVLDEPDTAFDTD